MLCKGDTLGRYIITSILGRGSFGIVYSAVDANERSYAIKLSRHWHDEQLSNERRIYSILIHSTSHTYSVGIPKIYDFFLHKGRSALVLDLLGESLHSKARRQGGRLSLKSVLVAGIRLVSNLQHMHEAGFLHRDVKPENILTGQPGNHQSRIYLVDLGLGTNFRDCTGNHYGYLENQNFSGTVRYAGVNALEGVRPARRDDLEALAYTLVELLRGELPWKSCFRVNGHRYRRRVLTWKTAITPRELGKGFPGMEAYMSYVRRLKFNNRPRYSFLQNCFQYGLDKIREADDGRFEWIK